MASLASLFGRPTSRQDDAPLASAARCGAGGPLEAELLDAAQAALDCSRDSRRFLNECEPVMARLVRAVRHVKQRRFSDERAVLESVPEHAEVIHFLLDCVRNRFPLRSKAAYVKQQLEEGSPAWKRAFQEHLRSCPTCATVDLTGPSTLPNATQGAPRPRSAADARLRKDKRPIPFILELLALVALVVPLLVLAPGCSCRARWIIAFIGIALMLPWLVLEMCRRVVSRRRLLLPFVPGRYAVGVRYRALGKAWLPSRAHPLCEPGSTAEASAFRACRSFGWWSRRPQLPVGATVVFRPSPLLEKNAFPTLELSCGARGWREAPIQMLPDGSISGLPQEVFFDGSALILGPASANGDRETWTKLGPWRWDWFYKVLAASACLGLAALVVSATLPPGLDATCFQSRAFALRRWPLRAVFLLDGSGSVDARMWTAEKDSAANIIRSFQDVYGGQNGLLHFGVVQFSTSTTLEVPLSSDVATVLRELAALPKRSGGTRFRPALDLCTRQLEEYSQAGSQTFDACVLLTDGQNDEPPGALASAVPSDTAIFGIYVGSEDVARASLRQLSTCGAADRSGKCHFFASASDFAAMRGHTEQVALVLTRGAEVAAAAPVLCTQPWWRALQSLYCLLGVLPAFAWWLYLQWPPPPLTCTFLRLLCAPLRLRAAAPPAKGPRRLLTAGRNEGRTSLAPVA